MPYTGTDLISAVQDDLKDASFSSTRILRYLNYGQNTVANTFRFKFWQTSFTQILTIGVTTVAQQSNHENTISGVLVDPANTATRFKLNRDTYLDNDTFYEQFPDPTTEKSGMPVFWTEYGDMVVFNCPIDKAYSYTQKYRKLPTVIAAGTTPDVPEAFRELLELYAVSRAEKYRGNHDIAATYKQDFEDGLEAMNIRYAMNIEDGPVFMPSNRTYIEL